MLISVENPNKIYETINLKRKFQAKYENNSTIIMRDNRVEAEEKSSGLAENERRKKTNSRWEWVTH